MLEHLHIKNVALIKESEISFGEGLNILTGETGADGKKIIDDDHTLLEIKTDGAMPLWLSAALAECEIYPAKFSKYATAYRDILQKGASTHACNL